MLERLQTREKTKISPLHLQKGGIPLLVKSCKSSQINKKCIRKITLLTAEYNQKCTCNKTNNAKTNLWPQFLTWDRHVNHVVG